jgi:hypothetical protein
MGRIEPNESGALTMTPKPKTTNCSFCGLKVTRVHVAGWPSLDLDKEKLEKECVEPSRVEEPFQCPRILEAAIEAGWVGRDGAWIGWPHANHPPPVIV